MKLDGSHGIVPSLFFLHSIALDTQCKQMKRKRRVKVDRVLEQSPIYYRVGQSPRYVGGQASTKGSWAIASPLIHYCALRQRPITLEQARDNDWPETRRPDRRKASIGVKFVRGSPQGETKLPDRAERS